MAARDVLLQTLSGTPLEPQRVAHSLRTNVRPFRNFLRAGFRTWRVRASPSTVLLAEGSAATDRRFLDSSRISLAEGVSAWRPFAHRMFRLPPRVWRLGVGQHRFSMIAGGGA
jgi:hypothetical protein